MSKLNTNIGYSSLKQTPIKTSQNNTEKKPTNKEKTKLKLTTTKKPTKTTSHSAKETQCIQFQEKQIKSQLSFS